MVAPRDVIAAAAPDPNEIGKKYVGKTAAGTYVIGKKDGKERKVYLYQVADNKECVDKYGTQVVVAQTAFTPVITIELLAKGSLGSKPGDPKSGVHNPEAFNADDYVALMPAYEFPGGLLEMESEYKLAQDRQALTRPGEVRPFEKPLVGGRPPRERRPAARVSGPILWTNLAPRPGRWSRACLAWPPGAAHTRRLRAGRRGRVP